ncbi:hypothetical protein MY11210_004669 [Beauveria gryllotalpidicola]
MTITPASRDKFFLQHSRRATIQCARRPYSRRFMLSGGEALRPNSIVNRKAGIVYPPS